MTTRTHLQTHRPVLLAIVNIKTSDASLRVSLHCLTWVCILSVLGTSTEHLATDLPATMLPLDLEISSPLNRTPAMTVEGLDPTLPLVLEPFCREVSAVEVLDHSHPLATDLPATMLPLDLEVSSPLNRTPAMTVEGLDPTLPLVLEPFCREVSAVEVLDHSHLLTSEPFNLHVASMATPMERTRTRKVIIITRLR